MNTSNSLLNKSFIKITDCFTCADGGISFIKLKTLLQTLVDKSNNGDKESEKVIAIVINMSKLIDVAERT